MKVEPLPTRLPMLVEHRRIQLYGWEGDWRTGRPVLTVYYLGGPDTTPEFTTGVALERYLASALAPRR